MADTAFRESPSQPFEHAVTDNLEDLLSALPAHVAQQLLEHNDRNNLLEIVLDLGRQPEARYTDREVFLSDQDVTRDDLEYVAKRIGRFGDDNRAGIERTLHRISAIRNRSGEIVGLTCRIGRAVYGTIAIIQDLVEAGESILLLGRPGVGKTTMLREAARVLADDLRKRVVVVDTSNEIAGDGDIPHPSIGRARRMQVATPTAQHAVMIEAVENHMPEVIVIDEIGTELEAGAARTIAERGVQLIGTAHGNTLANLMMNPTLSDLIGGIQSVTLSDEEARRRGTQKSILERKAPPTFSVMVEIRSRREVAVHHDVAATVDSILRGAALPAEIRARQDDGSVTMRQEEAEESDWDEFQQIRRTGPALQAARARASQRAGGRRSTAAPGGPRPRAGQPVQHLEAGERGRPVATEEPRRPAAEAPAAPSRTLRIYPFGVGRDRIESAIRQLNVPATIVRDNSEADVVLTLKNYYRRHPQPVADAEERGLPIYVLRSNTSNQIEQVLASYFHLPEQPAEAEELAGEEERPPEKQVMAAMQEAEDAIHQVMDRAHAVELAPQASYIRRLQHQLAERYNLGSRSRGREPNRRVQIYRGGSRW
jgi:stage III sporulation protein SpoIIIAA